MLGTGVVVGSITRARNQFLDQQLRDATSQQSNESAQSDALTQVEDGFRRAVRHRPEHGAGGRLFQSFNNLVNNPEDTGVRTTVVQSADALSRVFQNVNSTLTSVGQQLTANQSDDMNMLNSYGKQIAGLNATIRSATTQTQNANDLMDQRDVLLDKVASLANVTVTNNSDGTVNVSVGSSQLVQGTDATTLSLTGPNSLTARGDLTGGDLAGLAAAQDRPGRLPVRPEQPGFDRHFHGEQRPQDRERVSMGRRGWTFSAAPTPATSVVNQTLVNDPDKLAAAGGPGGRRCSRPRRCQQRDPPGRAGGR